MTKHSFFHRSRPALHPKKGFTLIEVLIAVAITAIIIAALYSTFFLSRKAVDAVDNSLVKLQECRAVLDVMKREIESAETEPTVSLGQTVPFGQNPYAYTLFKIDDRDFYGKEASQLVMTTFSPFLPGLTKITYAVEENDGKLVLRKKFDAAFGAPYTTKSVDLIEDVESFTVEAAYNDKWVKTWDSSVSNTPDQVRISVAIRIKKDENPITLTDTAKLRVGKML